MLDWTEESLQFPCDEPRGRAQGRRDVIGMNETPLELFRKGCGMARDLELRITREDDTQVERHVFPHPFVLIGSHPANDFCIRDDAVSPRHLYLQVIRGALFCFDLGSRTGVRWGQKAEPYGWLATGRCLQIGPYRLWLSEAGAGPYADRPDPFDPQQERISQNPSSPRSTIEVQSGDGRTTRVDCTQHLTMVGRAPGCPIRLDHPSVSRFHCGLINTPNGIWFVDLLSREGTLVYGERRRWARLQEGEAFRVGNFTLRLRYEPAASPTAGREVLEPTSKQAGEAREVMAFGLIPSPADTGQSLAADYSGAVVS